MELLCPVCNNLVEVDEVCPRCGGKLENSGLLQDYLGPYSPYLDQQIFDNAFDVSGCKEAGSGGTGFYNSDHGYCLHIYTCANCGAAYAYKVKRL